MVLDQSINEQGRRGRRSGKTNGRLKKKGDNAGIFSLFPRFSAVFMQLETVCYG
jgi:hypothetical protein